MSGLRIATVALAAAAVGLGAGSAAAAPDHAAAGKVAILGFTSAPWVGGVAPQVKPGGKITNCLDSGGGQRQIAVIVRVTGFPKSARIGVGLWGGNTGFQGTAEPQPSVKVITKQARPWTGAASPTGAGTGISYGADAYGPVNINGVWNAFVVVDGKVRASGHITLSCST